MYSGVCVARNADDKTDSDPNRRQARVSLAMAQVARHYPSAVLDYTAMISACQRQVGRNPACEMPRARIHFRATRKGIDFLGE